MMLNQVWVRPGFEFVATFWLWSLKPVKMVLLIFRPVTLFGAD